MNDQPEETAKVTFEKALEDLINSHSIENESNTPDFILAQYISDCLSAWNVATNTRDKWYKRDKSDGEE